MPRKKAKLEGRSKEERVAQRKELGSLQSLTVQPATKKRYNAAIDKFLVFLKGEKLTLAQGVAHPRDTQSGTAPARGGA